MRRRASPMASSSAWGRRSGTRRRSCMREGRSGSASSPPSSTSCRATGRSEGRRAQVGAIGVLGGAFNPPHIGHLVLAQEAAFQLGLDEVVLVPVGESPYKRVHPEPGPEVRLELARLAAATDPGVEASDVETSREGPSFSFRTLELMSDERPGDEFVFLMGADVAAGLESWRNPERVLELARVGIAARPGTALEEAEAALERLRARGGGGNVRGAGGGGSPPRIRPG